MYRITAGNLDRFVNDIVIDISALQNATNFEDPNNEGCYPTNKGDYLGEIKIYNLGMMIKKLQNGYSSFYIFKDGRIDYFVNNVEIEGDVVTISKRKDKAICLGALSKLKLMSTI